CPGAQPESRTGSTTAGSGERIGRGEPMSRALTARSRPVQRALSAGLFVAAFLSPVLGRAAVAPEAALVHTFSIVGYDPANGELAERLMAALEAGDAAGGDSRGRQSAALLVVRKEGGYRALNDRYIDLRVEDSAQPFVELRRLVSMALANAWMQHAYTLSEA